MTAEKQKNDILTKELEKAKIKSTLSTDDGQARVRLEEEIKKNGELKL